MPLTVLQVLPALDAGGVERGAVETAAELVRRGHRALAISAGGSLAAALTAAGARHYDWPIGRKSPLTLLLVRRLRRLLAAEQVDIVHARSRLPAWIAYLAWKGMSPRARPAFITTAHGPYSVNRYSGVMTRGQRVIAVSGFIRDYLLSNYPQLSPEKVVVIPRGVDPGQFPRGFTPDPRWQAQRRRDYPHLEGKTLITLPGRITRWKGHEDFIDVIAAVKRAHPDAHGLIAGAAHPARRRFYRRLRRLAAARGLAGDITFLGRRNDLREVLAVSAVVLSLARVPEAFGRTALEALALGRPVVACDHGGAREVLGELQPAGLVPPGDVAAVVEKILAFLAAPPAIAVNRTYTLERMLDSTLALYEQVRVAPE